MSKKTQNKTHNNEENLCVLVNRKSVRDPNYNQGEPTYVVTFSAPYRVFRLLIPSTKEGEMDKFDKEFGDNAIEIEGFVNVCDDYCEVDYYVGGMGCYDKRYITSYQFPINMNLEVGCKEGFCHVFENIEDPSMMISHICICSYLGVDASCPSHKLCPHACSFA